ncbi:5973_t:CDS:1, partial [Racocetra fulgida]
NLIEEEKIEKIEDILEAHETRFETLTDQQDSVLYVLQLKQSRPHEKLCAIVFLDAALDYVIRCDIEP